MAQFLPPSSFRTLTLLFALCCTCWLAVVAASAADSSDGNDHAAAAVQLLPGQGALTGGATGRRSLRLIVSEAKLSWENDAVAYKASGESKFVHVKEPEKKEKDDKKKDSSDDEEDSGDDSGSDDDKTAKVEISYSHKTEYDIPEPIKTDVILIDKPSVEAKVKTEFKGKEPEGATYEVVRSSSGGTGN